MDRSSLVYTVLIVVHLRRPFTYREVLALLSPAAELRTTSPARVSAS